MPVEIPCSWCGAPCERRPSQITGPNYKAFCNKPHEKAYKKTPEGKAWIQSWLRKPNVRLPHYRKKEEIDLEL